MTSYDDHHFIQAGKELQEIDETVKNFKNGILYPFLEVCYQSFFSQCTMIDFTDVPMNACRRNANTTGSSSSTCPSLVDTSTFSPTEVSKSASFPLPELADLKLLSLTVPQHYMGLTRQIGRGR